MEPREPARGRRRGRARRLRHALPGAAAGLYPPERRISTPCSTAPTWCWCTNGTSRRWWRRSAPGARGAAGSRCCSTTPTTARSATRRRSATSTCPAMTACSPSAPRWRASTRLGLGRPRVRLARGGRHCACFRPPAEPAPAQGAVWIGNWGDGERSAELEEFLLRRREAPACRSTSTACAIRTRPARCSRATAPPPRLAAEPAGARRVRPPPRHRARAAPLLRDACCPASRPSACSRRWPAASRWSARRGTTPKACSRRARTSWSRRTAPR